MTVRIQIEFLIGVDGLEALLLRPDTAGDEVVPLTGRHLLLHLPQDVGADGADVVAAFQKQVGQGEELPRGLVQSEVPAVLHRATGVEGGVEAKGQQLRIVPQHPIPRVRRHIALIFPQCILQEGLLYLGDIRLGLPVHLRRSVPDRLRASGPSRSGFLQHRQLSRDCGVAPAETIGAQIHDPDGLAKDRHSLQRLGQARHTVETDYAEQHRQHRADRRPSGGAAFARRLLRFLRRQHRFQGKHAVGLPTHQDAAVLVHHSFHILQSDAVLLRRFDLGQTVRAKDDLLPAGILDLQRRHAVLMDHGADFIHLSSVPWFF